LWHPVMNVRLLLALAPAGRWWVAPAWSEVLEVDLQRVLDGLPS
jgi:hypothetical protein